MPAVVVSTSTSGTRASIPPHPHVLLIGEDGRRLRIPLAASLESGSLAQRYAQHDRVGLAPILDPLGPGLRVLSGTFIFAGRDRRGKLDYTIDIESELNLLRGFAREGTRVKWRGYGKSEAGWFVITELQIRDRQRRHGDNAITVAEVTLNLTYAVNDAVNVGPVSGGDKTSSAAPKSSTGKVKTRTATKSYTVKRGDTLWKIARSFLGDGALYPRIADANKLKDPNKIYVGQKLKIPAS